MRDREKHQVLLGGIWSGNTFTMGNIINQTEKQGTKVWDTDVNYGGRVRLADQAAKENGLYMVSMTAAVLGYYANVLEEECPACFLVEPYIHND